MKIEIKIEKRHLVFLVVFVSFLFVVDFVSAQTPNPGHDASETGQGTFGEGNYVFPNNLNVDNSLSVNTGNLFFLANARGIYWSNLYDVSKPHIDYSSSTGLWISTGTTGLDVNIEGGNLVALQGITLGGETKTIWPKDVPAGFCVFSATQTACPAGWTRASGLDGRTIRGSSTPGGTGGEDTHKHVVDLGSKCNVQINGAACRPTNQNDQDTTTVSSWPPYKNVTICCKDASGEGVIEGTPSLPSLECTDITSSFTLGSASISCDLAHPFPLRGGCNSNCAWLSRNEIVGSTQYCKVITNIGNLCTESGQKDVQARITCCKN